MITPFTVTIPQADLDELRARLFHVRWSNELRGVGADYGVPLAPLKRLVAYWLEEYDWRKWEERLNRYPQFRTAIEGQAIYFLHIRSSESAALPLILTHGWPTSVIDYHELIGPLVDPRAHGAEGAQAFHLVIPAIPGFGFSGPTTEPGWDRFRVARAWAALMRHLGYERYGAHGNDWGSWISPEVGRCDPQRVVGVHVRQIYSFPSDDPAELTTLSPEERERWQAYQWWRAHLGAYDTLQSTLPQTLAHALADSPVGQLAWTYQMFGDTVDPEYLITTVMVYWLTNTAASAARFYYENAHAQRRPEGPTEVPLGLSCWAGEEPIRAWAERDHRRIVAWRVHGRGGHFITQAAPNVLVEDIRDFFGNLCNHG